MTYATRLQVPGQVSQRSIRIRVAENRDNKNDNNIFNNYNYDT